MVKVVSSQLRAKFPGARPNWSGILPSVLFVTVHIFFIVCFQFCVYVNLYACWHKSVSLLSHWSLTVTHPFYITRSSKPYMAWVRRFSARSLRLLQLCPRHSTARDSLFKQAQRKDRDTVDQLHILEKERPDELLGHIEHFCTTFLRCCLFSWHGTGHGWFTL